ncbi:MAG: SufE family protein [Crocinitomicaceae bacterium]|jgi:cysteine desulfuration protein SufE|nr:SufE family protein [Crocinitomicaceae bacterium]MDP4723154.1 SufE family protein [Crocinitomicaceae bacterium]MDP4739689.1 SufE family protein [Crocinitomicaceae bacterium]MDP4799434.1 SufE family protein [Crocinitomicaceae bacterium]MDP4806248.1 SufE family protein [Crocinitomicaceae bacterium]
MSIQEKQQEIIDEFAIYDDWMDKYEYIIELGKSVPTLAPELKTKERLIEGCQSNVWLATEIKDGKMQFSADSDAIITKGIIGLLIQVYNNESPAAILQTELFFINEIGLAEHLSPTRANGLLSMVQRMKTEALQSLAQ